MTDTSFHIFMPLQTLNAIILAICVGSTGSENVIIWFIIIFSLLISAAATIVSALGIQDILINSISNGKVTWNAVELSYSLLFIVLSVLGFSLSFSFAGRFGAGYVAAGIFFIVHTALYGCALYKWVQSQGREEEDSDASSV